jgi:adenine-specific DNA-methyltransferase
LIKYLGSKRTLIPPISKLADASQAKTSVDLFTGTTRVAQALKGLGQHVTTVDTASYSYAFGKTWIELDAESMNQQELTDAIGYLAQLKGQQGYFTKTFCQDARYFQPQNGERVDSIRDAIETDYKDTWLYYPLLTSLMLAADRVDSTTGIQMAFLKQWASRSYANLTLKDPGLLSGGGLALQQDATLAPATLPPMDLAYLDPPYNQHRYFANYHIWETLVRWDKPESYGIANKRIDVRDAATKSPFNSKKTMADALETLITQLQCETLILSYNNESWLSRDQLEHICGSKGAVRVLDFDFKRYVGSQIGVYNKVGVKVSEPKHARNIEHLVIAGPKDIVARMANAL